MSRLVGIEHMLCGAGLGRSLLRVRHTHLGHGRVVVDSSRGRLHCARSARRRVQLAQSTHSRCQHARACPRGHEAHRNSHLQARLDNSTLPNPLLFSFRLEIFGIWHIKKEKEKKFTYIFYILSLNELTQE